MKNRKLLFIVFSSILLIAVAIAFKERLPFLFSNSVNTKELKNGDIIFQESQSSQCKAVQLATHSRYAHCGIIYINNGKSYVYEAIQPVKVTPLEQWIKRGKNNHYVIKRLSNANEVLTPAVLKRMKEEGEHFKGKNYDLTFEWSDNRIYCSELVWKVYKRGANIEVGALEQLKDFDLSNPIVQAKIKERYGSNIPLNETVISPASIFNDPNLVTIFSN